jgi:hypothetical protein
MDPPDTTSDPRVHTRSELAADLRTLLRHVEEVHPDPFVGYESRTALHARVERLIRTLPETATTEDFYRLAAPVVAGLDDAHSLVYPPDDETAPGGDAECRLPLSFRVVGEELYVEAVDDDRLGDLLGGRLLAVDGVSVSELVRRSRRFRGSENQYGALAQAAADIERVQSLGRLLDCETGSSDDAPPAPPHTPPAPPHTLPTPPHTPPTPPHAPPTPPHAPPTPPSCPATTLHPQTTLLSHPETTRPTRR